MHAIKYVKAGKLQLSTDISFSNIIRKACNASGDDKLIFTIAHSSSIYELLIKSLQLFAPLVFVGITDDLNHASWTKAGGEIITIPETSQGTLDTDHLRAQLGNV